MKDTKRIFTLFSFYDRTGIEKFLEKQARNGWLLVKMSAFGWKFQRIEPQEIHFSVTYFPSASAFDPEPSEDQQVFRQFCEHTGWRLAASGAQMQIFFNTEAEPVPIETEALLELENIHATAKKSYLPTYVMQLCLGILQLVMLGIRLNTDSIGFMANNANLFAGVCWGLGLVICCGELVQYYSWLKKARSAAETDGSFVDTRSTVNFQLISVLVFLAALAFMLLSFGDSRMGYVAIFTVAGILVITAVIVGMTELMKRLKVNAGMNMSVTILLAVVLSIVFTGVLVFGIIQAVMSDREEDIPYATYEYKGHTYDVYHHDIPLTIEDLMDTGYDGYSYIRLRDEESVFLSRLEATQRPRYDALEQPDFSYTVVDVKWNALYGACLKDMLDDYDGWSSEDIYGNVFHDSFILADAAPWGADQVYRLKQGGVDEMSQCYILCYGGRLVKIRFSWDVTAEQMAAVGDLLKR